jgi:hypothetical protein
VDLELHEVRHAARAGQAGEAHRVVGVGGAGGVGQQQDVGRDRVEDVAVAGTRDVHAAQRDSHDLGAAGDDRVAHHGVRGELAGPQEQARAERARADDERVGGGHDVPA